MILAHWFPYQIKSISTVELFMMIWYDIWYDMTVPPTMLGGPSILFSITAVIILTYRVQGFPLSTSSPEFIILFFILTAILTGIIMYFILLSCFCLMMAFILLGGQGLIVCHWLHLTHCITQFTLNSNSSSSCLRQMILEKKLK